MGQYLFEKRQELLMRDRLDLAAVMLQAKQLHHTRRFWLIRDQDHRDAIRERQDTSVHACANHAIHLPIHRLQCHRIVEVIEQGDVGSMLAEARVDPTGQDPIILIG